MHLEDRIAQVIRIVRLCALTTNFARKATDFLDYRPFLVPDQRRMAFIPVVLLICTEN